MGDFVDVFCEVQLPDGLFYDEHWLQTSDLVNARFTSCTITKDGRLVSNGKDQYFHGWMDLYGQKPDAGFVDLPAMGLHKELGWRKYMVKFTDGQLVEIITAKEYSQREGVMPRYFEEKELDTAFADSASLF